jgi:chemotaxis protein CheX
MTPFPLENYRESLGQVTTSVFETMLALPVRPATLAPGGSPSWYTAAVYYAGEWKGGVLVQCSRQQAADWAARFLSLASPATDEDALDTLGELANVIAGNLKPILPAGVGLTFPSVVQGSDYCLRTCGGNLSETLTLADPLGPFQVTLLEVVDP